jgi:hypothetical protein
MIDQHDWLFEYRTPATFSNVIPAKAGTQVTKPHL